MKIRRFRKSDSIKVYELIRKNDLETASKFYPKKIINEWLKELSPAKILKKSMERICFVAEKDKKIVGYVSLSEDEVKKLFVLPKFHKKGIGKKLLDKIEKVARGKRIKKLVLYSNFYAEPFYKKCGFKKIKISLQKAGSMKYKSIYMGKKLK